MASLVATHVLQRVGLVGSDLSGPSAAAGAGTEQTVKSGETHVLRYGASSWLLEENCNSENVKSDPRVVQLRNCRGSAEEDELRLAGAIQDKWRPPSGDWIYQINKRLIIASKAASLFSSSLRSLCFTKLGPDICLPSSISSSKSVHAVALAI